MDESETAEEADDNDEKDEQGERDGSEGMLRRERVSNGYMSSSASMMFSRHSADSD